MVVHQSVSTDASADASTDVSTLGSTSTDASTNVSTGDSTDVSTFWMGRTPAIFKSWEQPSTDMLNNAAMKVEYAVTCQI